MKLEPGQFDAWENKRVTLLGLSGVGKTRLATLLRKHDWFHYSGDYRIGTRYLDEAILDNVKQQVMGVPFLRKLLRSDSIYISNNITVDNLSPVSSFLGKVGNPERGGLPLKEFKRRQSLHRMAEIAAMKDVPEFIRKARDIYGYRHFVNDACAGLCELDDPNLIEVLAEHTLILYVEATDRNEPALLQRARGRPILFREAFLDEQLSSYMKEHELEYVALVDPDDFAHWIVPELFRSRLPRYREIAAKYGYTVTTDELAGVRDDADFLELLKQTIARRPR